MQWHFSPETGSPYWLERARTLDFDPLTDIRTHADLVRFPNVAAELRDVRVEDLIPRGYGTHPDVVGVFESGGTTGAPNAWCSCGTGWNACSPPVTRIWTPTASPAVRTGWA